MYSDLLTLWDRFKSNYLLQKIAQAIFVVWFVTSVTFFVVRAMPGNVVDILIQELTTAGVSPEDARAQAASLIGIDLDRPAHEQYV